MANNKNEPPKTAKEYFDRGNERYHNGDFDDAIADFNEAIRLKPDFVEALGSRGNAWGHKGEYDKAIADYNESIRLKPDDERSWYNRGRTWNAKGEYDKAIADLNEAIRLKPDDASTWNNRGVAWSKKGEDDKAIADYDEAIGLNPESAFAWNNRGNAWKEKGVWDNAIADYNEAIRLQPDLQGAIHNLANVWSLKASSANTEEFRKSEKLNMKKSDDYEKQAQELLPKIGKGLGIGFAGTVFIELLFIWNGAEANPFRLLPWLLVVAAISSPFFLKYWALQKRRYETLTLAYGFQRKAILEERVFLYAGGDDKFRQKLLESYLVHWMEKSPLEVMLAIGGKSKGMGGSSSAASELLREMEKTLINLKDKTGKDGA